MHSAPFLKWAGGKRWLAPRLSVLLNASTKWRLIEPFLGSGAAFFYLEPARALLGDRNEELIACYRAVRDDVESIIKTLGRLRINKETFENFRRAEPVSDVARAVRLIYLNRTAFNGLYRVNRQGHFNVPFGCKENTKLCEAENLRHASAALKRAVLRCQDFRKTLAGIKPERDLLYADPPYTVKHDNNGFRRYNEQIFTWHDQEDLAEALVGIVRKGGRVVVSNAHHEAVKKLYPRALFHAFTLNRATCMAADPSRRGLCTEWLLVSTSINESRSQLSCRLSLE